MVGEGEEKGGNEKLRWRMGKRKKSDERRTKEMKISEEGKVKRQREEGEEKEIKEVEEGGRENKGGGGRRQRR